MTVDVWWQALGPWAASMAIAVAWITHLQKALTTERGRSDHASEELLALAERALPMLTDSASSLRQSAAIIRRQSELIARQDVIVRDLEQRLRRAES